MNIAQTSNLFHTHEKPTYSNIDKEYLKNTYRVLLTKARQGMVMFIPKSSEIDHTRPKAFYDETYEYLKEIGIEEIK